MKPIRKELVIGVILLFIGLAFAPTINANVSKEGLIEFTTEVGGLNGGKQTVELTHQQAVAVEALFDSIRERLNTTESREEAEEIFKEVVVELDKYGLLGGLSVKQAQRMILFNNDIQENIDSNKQNESTNCLIFGKLTNTVFFGPGMRFVSSLSTFIETLGIFIYEHYKINSYALFYCWGICQVFIVLSYTLGIPYYPLRIGSSITLGSYHEFGYENETIPSNGSICTIGSKGLMNWDGKLIGRFKPIDITCGVGVLHLIYEGIKGFFGIRLHNKNTENTLFFGYARIVNIEYFN